MARREIIEKTAINRLKLATRRRKILAFLGEIRVGRSNQRKQKQMRGKVTEIEVLTGEKKVKVTRKAMERRRMMFRE